jgi:hypothetical protein
MKKSISDITEIIRLKATYEKLLNEGRDEDAIPVLKQLLILQGSNIDPGDLDLTEALDTLGNVFMRSDNYRVVICPHSLYHSQS